MKNANQNRMNLSSLISHQRINFSFLISHFSFQEGFTLIELMIVFSIIIILSSVGLAAFSSYSRQQTLQTSAFDVVTMLNVAKTRALSQVKPTDCTETMTLQGYEMTFTAATGEYDMSVLCGDTSYALVSKTLPNGITFGDGTSSDITFNVLGSETATGGEVVISGYGTTKTITVSTLGNITVE